MRLAFLIEVIVDRTMHGREFLDCLHPPKSLHGALSSPERLAGVFGSVVESSTHLLTIGVADLLQGGAVGSEAVRHHSLRPTVALHRLLDEGKRRSLIAVLSG